MADINKEASWVTARLMEVSNATQDGTNILITNANIQNFTPTDVVRTSAQELTDAEQAQVRTNIGAASNADVQTAIAGVQSDITDLSDDKMDKLPEGSVAGNIPVIDNNNNIADSGKSLADIYDAAMISKTASGSIVTITDGADDVPINAMTVQIEAVQAGNGDPSPSNVRAISGWDAVNILRYRKNILPFNDVDVKLNGVNFNVSANGYVKINGTATAFTSRGLVLFTAEQAKIYTAGMPTVPGSIGEGRWFLYDNTASSNVTGFVKTIPSEIDITVGHSYSLGFTVSQNESCDYSATPIISYEPIEGNTYPITFPTEAGTVYGAELTVKEDGSGVLTKTWLRLVPSQGWLTAMGYRSGYPGVYCNIPSSLRPSYNTDGVRLNVLSEIMPTRYTYSADLDGIFVNGTTGFGLRFKASDLAEYGTITDSASGLAAIQAYNTAHPLNIIYKLATPRTYALTAEQVITLFGLNNIWADTGDISVTYRADPTLATAEQAQAIKKSIAPVEESYTASQLYTTGRLLYVGDTLYVTIAAISAGATLTVGTNIRETTIDEMIYSIS